MSTLIDIIGASILVGILLLCVFGWTGNLNVASYNKTFSVVAQTNTVTLARMIEFDFNKIAYHYSAPLHPMLVASSDTVAFKCDLRNTGSDTNTIRYYTSTPAAVAYTRNPRDRILYRVEDGAKTPMNLGVTSLKFKYYNKDGYVTSVLDSIRSIQVDFTIESPAPVDTTYAAISWEKRFYPKNLSSSPFGW